MSLHPHIITLKSILIFFPYLHLEGDSLARGPKLLSMYTVEQRWFLVRKYWQTGSLEHARRHFERNLVKDVHHRSVVSRNWLKR